MWPLIFEVAGGSITLIVLGAYALAYGVLRLEHRQDPSDRCPSIYCTTRKNRYGEYRCEYDANHEGPHHAVTKGRDRRDLWWSDDRASQTEADLKELAKWLEATEVTGGAGGSSKTTVINPSTPNSSST